MQPFQYCKHCNCLRPHRAVYTGGWFKWKCKSCGEKQPWFQANKEYGWRYNKGYARTVNRQLYPKQKKRKRRPREVK